MHLRLLLLFFGLLSYLGASAQYIVTSRRTSYYTYVYRLNTKEAQTIYRKDAHVVKSDYFHTLVDSFPTDKTFDRQTLPQGHYLFTKASGDQLEYELQSVTHLNVKVLNNQVDLSIWVADSLGNPLADALVEIQSRRLPFDAKTQTFRLRKTNRRGLLAVTYRGMTTYHQLEARYKNSRAKRVKKAVLQYSKLGYVIQPFFDVYYSVKNGDPTGFVRRIAAIWNPRYRRQHYRPIAKANGYLAFNKPLYQPGDTVKVKAFITDKKGNPVNVPMKMWLLIPGKPKLLTLLQPYRKGGYSYEFKLVDSLGLRLDQEYDLELEDEKGRWQMSNSFRYEDYELNSYAFTLRSEKETHYQGTSNTLYAKGTDENDLNVMDARVKLTVLPESLLGWNLPPKAFVPDTLWKHEQPLDAVGETKITLPDSIFPSVSLTYRIEAIFLTSNNERHTQTLRLAYQYTPHEVTFLLQGDTLLIDYQVAGVSKPMAADLIGYVDQEEEQVLVEKKVSLPWKEKVNPVAYSYEVAGEGFYETFYLKDDKADLQFLASRTADSLFVQVQNPRNIPFWYTIYRKNGERLRGHGTQLNFRKKTSVRQTWFVSLQYIWNDEVKEEEYQVPFSSRKLNIDVQQPLVVYPGQKAQVQIAVTDAKGQPVENVDLTAYGITRKFKTGQPPRLPNFEKMPRARRILNRFTLRDKTEGYPSWQDEAHQKLEWTRWRQQMGLDSLAYYQFLYPQKGIFTQYTPILDQRAQVAPYAVHNGELLETYLLYLDGRPIYFNEVDIAPRYAFPADSGYHILGIRTYDKQITIDSVLLLPGKKLIMSLETHASPPNVRIDSLGKVFTRHEEELLKRYLFYVYNTFNSDFAYIQQRDNIQLLGPGLPSGDSRGALRIGLLNPEMTRFNLVNQFQTDFDFEPGYAYEFGPKLLKMRSVDYLHNRPTPFAPFTFYKARINPNFRELAVTEEEIDSLWQLRQEQNVRVNVNLPQNTDVGFGRLNLQSISLEGNDPSRIKYMLLYQAGSPDLVRVYPKETRWLHQLKPGRYKLVFVLYFNEYAVHDSIDILPDGTNYIQIQHLPVHLPDLFIRQANEAVHKSGEASIKVPTREVPFTQNVPKPLHPDNTIYSPKQSTSAWFTHPVEGRVTDDTGEGIPGVNVLVKGSETGTSTDMNGFYRLYTPAYGELEFSFIGYVTKEKKILGQPTINIALDPDMQRLSEVVVMGYAQGVSSITSAVAITSASNLSIPGDINSALQGKLAGILGQPGSSLNIRIRGVSSLSPNSSPLFIVDGVPYSGSELDRASITNIEVMKQEVATALYGARAAYGVVIVTTKKGKEMAKQGGLESLVQSQGLRNRFSDYAYWQPRLTTNAEGKASFEVTYPDDLTNWRTFVLAMDGQKRSGSTESSVKAFKTLTGTLSVPRFLVQGDSTWVVGKALNYSPDTLSITTAFHINETPAFSRQAQVINSVIDTFRLAATTPDSLQLAYTVRMADGFLDGEKRPIAVYPLGTLETKGTFLSLNRDTTVTLATDPGLGKVTLYAQGDILPILLEEMEQIRKYEYLCNEQAASKLKSLLLQKKVLAYLHQPFAYEKEIPNLIKKLQQSQATDGTWGWWPNTSGSIWISRHVAEALVQAEVAGYATQFNRPQLINYYVYELGRDAITRQQRSEHVQILRLLQAMAAKVDYQRYLEPLESRTLDTQDRLLIIELRQAAKLPYRLDTLRKHQQETMLGNLFWGNEGYALTNSSVTNTVIAYRILRNQGGNEQQLGLIRNYFLEKRHGGYWRNTYESALILETILPDLLGGETSVHPSRLVLSGAIRDTVATFPYHRELIAGEKITIRKEGKLPVYLTTYQQFQNTKPQKVEKEFIVKSFFDKQTGNLIRLEAGRPVVLTVEVDVQKDADYVMVEVPIPAACSYEEKRPANGEETYREYFRQKTSIFCDHLAKGKHRFTVRLLPRYSGRYTLNPARAELMYFPTFFGRNEIKSVKVQ